MSQNLETRGPRILARLVGGIVVGIVVLSGIVIGGAMGVTSRQIEVDSISEEIMVSEKAVTLLSAAIRIPTVSNVDGDSPEDEFSKFAEFREFLSESFPLIEDGLKAETVGDGNLLYTWEGSGRDSIVLLAHHDVVPVETTSIGEWSHPPFSGTNDGEFVWGRGALDNKAALVGIFSAIESLMIEGLSPTCSVHVGSTSNEEIRGRGPELIARLLVDRGVKADFVLDEGLLITENIVPGIDGPVAFVGTSEKGFLSLDLVAEVEASSHLAMPPRITAVGKLAAVIADLEGSPLDATLEGPPRELYRWLAPEMNFGMKVVASNLWLFAPMVRNAMESKRSTNAIVRTTMVPTMLSGSKRFNVMPAEARARIVFFIHPSDSTTTVIDYVAEIAGDRARVDVVEAHEPTRVSPSGSASFTTLARTIREIFPSAIVAPTLLVGNVDARHFADVSPNIFRFSPIVAHGQADIERLHGVNERISLEGLADVERFYRRLIKNSCGAHVSGSAGTTRQEPSRRTQQQRGRTAGVSTQPLPRNPS